MIRVFILLCPYSMKSLPVLPAVSFMHRDLLDQIVAYLHVPINTEYRTKKTPWPIVRKRTIPTERPPLVDEI
jgi:hypothetical protein